MNRSGSPSLKEIAVRAEVDRSTVSLALRNDSRIRLDTRQRIQTLAVEMGYRQNPVVAQLMAQLRAGQQRHFCGNLALLDLSPPGSKHDNIGDAVCLRANALGYGVERFRASEYTPRRIEQILMHRGIRGIIITCLWGRTNLPEEYKNLWSKYACCVLGLHARNPDLHFSSADHHFCTLLAMEKLVEKGFERIGLAIHAGVNVETEYRFVGGYVVSHLKYPKLQQVPIHFNHEADRAGFLGWFEHHRPQAIISLQVEMLRWLRDANHRVPTDVSLVHLDTEVAEGWAGVRQRREERAISAVDVVVAQINRNEKGSPPCQRSTMIEGIWEPGATLGDPPRIDREGEIRNGRSLPVA